MFNASTGIGDQSAGMNYPSPLRWNAWDSKQDQQQSQSRGMMTMFPLQQQNHQQQQLPMHSLPSGNNNNNHNNSMTFSNTNITSYANAMPPPPLMPINMQHGPASMFMARVMNSNPIWNNANNNNSGSNNDNASLMHINHHQQQSQQQHIYHQNPAICAPTIGTMNNPVGVHSVGQHKHYHGLPVPDSIILGSPPNSTHAQIMLPMIQHPNTNNYNNTMHSSSATLSSLYPYLPAPAASASPPLAPVSIPTQPKQPIPLMQSSYSKEQQRDTRLSIQALIASAEMEDIKTATRPNNSNMTNNAQAEVQYDSSARNIAVITATKTQHHQLPSSSKHSNRQSINADEESPLETQDDEADREKGRGRGRGRKRVNWTPEQDAILHEAVKRHGPKDWNTIAALFPGRNADNVRLRYKYFLQYPEHLRDRKFTSQEDEVIMREALEGRQWKKIGATMGRSCGAIRNRYDVLRRLAKRGELLAAEQSKESRQVREKFIETLAEPTPPASVRTSVETKSESEPSPKTEAQTQN